jgi:SAM-dependent methyltransferase
MSQSRTFDSVAALYDAQRSGYPEALFADLVSLGGLKRGDRVLEIGCGSGQATAGLVALGLDVDGLDPGPALIELARLKFSDSPLPRFAVTSFEEWGLEDRKFRLVAAAQSWHWVRPDVGFPKAADALSPDGHLAIFGHTPHWSADIVERLRPVYLKWAPELWGTPSEVWYLPDGPIAGLIVASGRFGAVTHRSYAWRREYTPSAFAAYLATRSDYARLEKGRRDQLLRAVEAALPPSVETEWVTNMYVAPRR